jgi:hypothetical protein
LDGPKSPAGESKAACAHLILYPKRLLNTADHAHDAKGFSALDYNPAMASPAVAVMLKNPTVKETTFGFRRAEDSSSAFTLEPVTSCNVLYVEAVLSANWGIPGMV